MLEFNNLLHSIGAFRYQEAVTTFNKAKDEKKEGEDDTHLIESLALEVERLNIYQQKSIKETLWTEEDLLNNMKLFTEQNSNYLSKGLINKIKIIKEELTKGAQIFPNSTYLYAASKGKVEIVDYLLNHGADLGVTDKVCN